MDVLDVYKKAKTAVDFARQGNGPTLLELKTFRLCGHSRRDPCNYMTKEERQQWALKDPIPAYEKLLLKQGVFTAKFLEELKSRVEYEIKEAVAFGQNSPDPDPVNIYADLYVNMEVPR